MKKSGLVKFYTVSLLVAECHVDKILLFRRCQECQKVLRNWGQNNRN